jgi:hypothetical protein
VSPSAIGQYEPYPCGWMRCGSTPSFTSALVTASARCFVSVAFFFALPRLSPWPASSMYSICGFSLMTVATSFRSSSDFGSMVDLPVAKRIFSLILTSLLVTITRGSTSGQPSSSWNPLTVSFSSGHLSSLFAMPSPSLSVVRQPSLGSGGRASSFSSGHLSSASATPSPSLSVVGQPSWASGGRPSSLSVGHLSWASTKPSPSRSGGGGGGAGGAAGGGGSAQLERASAGPARAASARINESERM